MNTDLQINSQFSESHDDALMKFHITEAEQRLHTRPHVNHSAGFTLIELIISLALGLLIVAAATQLFIAGLTSYKLQKAMADIQDNASLGLNFIINDIRKANLSAPVPALNNKIGYAGIIMTPDNIGEKINLNCNPACFESNQLADLGTANVVGKKNNQLIIRYQVPQATVDCSGQDVEKNTFVIQRYFVASTSTDSRQSLRCQAAQYTQAQLDKITGTNKLALAWEASQVILPNVDYFKVRIGYMDGDLNNVNSTLVYSDIKDYVNLDQTEKKYQKNIDGVVQPILPHVHAIQIGVLVQSESSTGLPDLVVEKNKADFTMFGKEKIKLDTQYQNTHLRQVVEQTISLRNAMGWINEGVES
ncbi:pilus assembly protein PilW [Acinetobacter gyllenbergii]|uniref:Prepilin-type N-terminal cleavage/methylation domain-containing protein n=1 Tax=Acinetobacter gyllenbergii CIP 110306 = MTCC 11365 TaxID=1217657 RepID=A0A829HM87_9GAMM|nr:PilW family protein [Acinetobacter gyllenbergii]EPF93076.1 hypothetical protein F957_00422 [Acinetobacter gyllenbergii CIP 110306 = MTCC 11365]EPH31386.1 Type IV fimbrial biogenesis protein PilW [Acinetobacter gyllenbergii CIP 110306 = MTCC 11365]GMA10182.1 pilus assembly protein PilW [Acinetobacter gyllenbergii]